MMAYKRHLHSTKTSSTHSTALCRFPPCIGTSIGVRQLTSLLTLQSGLSSSAAMMKSFPNFARNELRTWTKQTTHDMNKIFYAYAAHSF